MSCKQNTFDQKVKFTQHEKKADIDFEIVKRQQGCTPSPPVNHSPIIPVKTLPKALFTFPCLTVCVCVFTRLVEAMLY